MLTDREQRRIVGATSGRPAFRPDISVDCPCPPSPSGNTRNETRKAMKLIPFTPLLNCSSTKPINSQTKAATVLGYAVVGLVCLATAFRAWSAECVSPPPGLVAWWQGEGSANDMVGANDGVLINGATFGPGEVGTAFSLDGSGAVIEVPNSPALNFAPNAAITVELWAYRTTPSAIAHILGKRVGVSAVDINYEMAWDPTYGLQFNSGTGVGALTGIQLPMHTWTHLAGTFEAGTYRFYINGALVATATGLTLGPTNSARLKIGGAGDCEKFGGLLDEVSIYSRALSNVEIAAIYNASSAGKCVPPPPPCTPPPAGLVGWWPGEGDANDIGGANDGVSEGGVAFAAGEVGQAFSFNDTNADVRVPASASLNLGLADGFTIETWINPADVTQTHPLVEWNDGSFGVCFWIADCAPPPALGKLLIDVKDTSYTDHCFSTAVGLLVSNIWQHVAATYVRSNGYTVLYVNGVPVGQATLGAFTPRTIGDLYVGVRPYDAGAGTRFVGLMDELGLYNRALSASEISGIYNAGSAGKCPVAFITSQPQGRTAVVGSTVTFVVTAGGTPPLSYQWLFNGTNITGATSSSLTLTNVQPDQAGTYLVIVTNALGAVTSSNAVLAVVPPSPCATPSAGLVAWWPGDGNANDIAGANNGTLSGGATFTSGEVGQVFSFDGVNGSVIIPDSSSLRLTTNFTIEAWINARAVANQGLVSKVGGSGGNYGYQLLLYDDNTLMGLLNSPGEGWPSSTVRNTTPIALGTWNHVAFTYNHSAMMLYLNGLPVATNVIGPKTIATTGANLRISGDDNNHVYFNGLIDEVAIYSRALSASEIWAIYSAGSAGKCGLPPVIVTPPQSQITVVGASVGFSVAAGGSPPLNYQWQFNGTNISGATGTFLALTNVELPQAGSYTVEVTNLFGAVTSSDAVLTVISSPQPPPTNGLVAYYPLDGDASDASGNGNDGVVVGALPAVDRFGITNGCYSFDGHSQYIHAPADRLPSGTRTVSLWFKADRVDIRPGFLGYGGNGGPPGTSFLMGLNVWGGGAFTVTTHFNSYTLIVPYTAPPTNVWHQWVVVMDDAGMSFYVDGQWIGSRAGTCTTYVTGKQLALGDICSPWGAVPFADVNEGYFDGCLDEVRFYNRALSDSEVQQLYLYELTTCPAPFIGSQPHNQVSYW